MIYLDNAATTQMSDGVKQAMIKAMDVYGNPSSMHSFGERAKDLVEESREKVARLINAKPSEIYFTSGGTESNNWVLRSEREYGFIIESSLIEHPSVYLSFNTLKMDADNKNIISLESLEECIKAEADLISVMTANNETGAIQPIRKIVNICHDNGVLFHTDAVQAIGHIPVDVKETGVDFLSMSAHKFHGPKGIGCLYIREGIELGPLLEGGGQERGLRSGTENVLAIVGMGVAAEEAMHDLQNGAMDSVKELRDKLALQIKSSIEDVIIVTPKCSVPNILNVIFKGIDSQRMVALLDIYGVACSAGSACHSHEAKPSHVLKAMGYSDEDANSAVRFSLSKYTTLDEINEAFESIKRAVKVLRSMENDE